MSQDNSPPLARWIGNPEFEAIAAAVAAVPNDQAPRLVLSDWLRERGDDAAADLASQESFPTVLAFVRFQKAGVSAAEAVAGITQAFGALRTAMLPAADAIRRAGEVLVEAQRQADAARPATLPPPRPGRRDAAPKPDRKRNRPPRNPPA